MTQGIYPLTSPVVDLRMESAGGSPTNVHRTLMIGVGRYKSSGGAELAIEHAVTPNTIGALVDEHSELARAATRFWTFNKTGPLDLLIITETHDSAGDQRAEALIELEQINGSTVAGAMPFYFCDEAFAFSVTVAKGEAINSVYGKILTAINGLGIGFTAVATDAGDAVKVTAPGGSNFDGLRIFLEHHGVGLKMTEDYAEFSGAVTNRPTDLQISAFLAGLTQNQYDTVIFSENQPQEPILAWLDDMYHTRNAMTAASGFSLVKGSYASVVATANALNSPSLTLFGSPDNAAMAAWPLLLLAEFAAKRAARLTDGADLTGITLDAGERTGGLDKASLPYHNTPMNYQWLYGEGLNLEELTAAYAAGVSFLVPAPGGLVLGEMVTTYKKDGAGLADETFHYLNAIDCTFAVQQYFFDQLKSRFAQSRATAGAVVGSGVSNPALVASYLDTLYTELAEQKVVQGGSAALQAFKANRTVTLSGNVYTVNAKVAIMAQFRQISGVVTISYDFSNGAA